MKTVLALVACIVVAVVYAEPPTAFERTKQQVIALYKIYKEILKDGDVTPEELNTIYNNRLSAQMQAMKRICLGNNAGKPDEIKPVARESLTQDYQAACKMMDSSWEGKEGESLNLAGKFKQIRDDPDWTEFAKANDQQYRELLKEYEELYRAEGRNNPPASVAELVSERLDVVDEMFDPIIDAKDDYDSTRHAFDIYFDIQVMAQMQAMKRICIGNNLDKPEPAAGEPPVERSYPVKPEDLTTEYTEACKVFTDRWTKDGPGGKLSLKNEFAKAMKENEKAWKDFAAATDPVYRPWLNAYEAEYRKAATKA